MLQKIYLMVFERYIPELKKYDSISFLHQPMASGQPLKIVQRHMAHPVDRKYIDFESTSPPEFESFWRNKTETKYVRLVSTYLHFFRESKVFTGVLKFPLFFLFF